MTRADFAALPAEEQWRWWRALAHRRRVLDERPQRVNADVLRTLVEVVLAQKETRRR